MTKPRSVYSIGEQREGSFFLFSNRRFGSVRIKDNLMRCSAHFYQASGKINEAILGRTVNFTQIALKEMRPIHKVTLIRF
jgi:hypothetical protein